MSRSMMNSLMCLSAIVVLSTIVISSYLFTSTGPTRRPVHLIPHVDYSKNFEFNANRLFDTDDDEEETGNDEWMHESVLKPHRQSVEKAAHKFDIASSSRPNSDDDRDKKVDAWRQRFKGAEVNSYHRKVQEPDHVHKVIVAANRLYNDQPLNLPLALSPLALSKRNKSSVRNVGEICEPLNSVAMIKTHKCSSSTLQNILLRRAEDLNLTVAIPKESVYFGSPAFFNRRYIFMDDGRRKYNIMASHMRFRSLRDVQAVMDPQAKYITIFRDPIKQFESMFTYYGWRARFRADMHRFLLRPERYFHLFEPKSTRVAGRNPMCYDNGLDARRLSPGDEIVDSFINVLDESYDLVLIAEYFDESLILLKDLMCWTLDDMVYFSHNARNNDSVLSLSRGDKAAIRSWNWADYKLYTHFNRTLWERIDIYGRGRMQEELKALAAKKEALSQDCIGEVVKSGDKRMWYPPGIRVNSFLVNENATHRHLCTQLTQPELVYLRYFRNNQLRSFHGQRVVRKVNVKYK